MADPFFAIKIGPLACFCVNTAGIEVDRSSEIIGPAAGDSPRRIADAPESSEGGDAVASPAGSSSSKRTFRERAMAKLRGHSHSSEADLDNPDGEVRMPDRVHDDDTGPDWINTLLAAFWPRISAAVHKIMDEMVAPMVNDQLRAHHVGALANFRFTKFTLGDKAPRVTSVEVSDITTRSQEAGVRLILPIVLESNVDVQMHAFVATLGAKSVVFRGELVVSIVPLINEVPVVGGIIICFYNSPVVEMDFTGLASIAELKSLDWVVHDVIQTILASIVVVPNVIAVPLGTREQGVDQAELNNPPPAWVLRVTALRAKSLVGNDYRLFSKRTSDPFLRIKVADQTWCSTVIYRTCDPTWPETETRDFIVYNERQQVSIEVVDKEHFGRAVLIGKARSIFVGDCLEHQEGEPLPLYAAATDFEATPDATPDAGELWVRFERLEISRAGILDKLKESDTRTFLFEVKVGELSFPALLGEQAMVQIKIGDKVVKHTRKGTVRHKKSTTSAVQDALAGVAVRCKDKGMKPDDIAAIVDMDTKTVTELVSNRLSHSDTPEEKEQTKAEAQRRWEAMKRHTAQTIGIHQVLSITVSAAVVAKEDVVVSILDSYRKEVSNQTIPLKQLISGSASASKDLGAFETTDPRMDTWSKEKRIQADVKLIIRELVKADSVTPQLAVASSVGESVKGHDKVPPEWLNLLVNRLWKRIDLALKKIMEEKVEPLINAQLRTLFHLKAFGKVNEFHFVRFTLGSISPLVGPVQVNEFTSKSGQPGVDMVIPIDLKSKVDVQMKATIASFGAKSIDFRGDLVVRLVPLLDEVPVLGGVVAYFRELPKIDMDFTGLANVVDLVPGFDHLVHDVINNVMLQMLVLPNVIAVPIGTEEQGVDRATINNPAPLGILKVTAVQARQLVAHDWHLMSKATSDPYIRCELSAVDWKSSTVKGTCDPVWTDDSHNFMVFDFGQRLKVEVFDNGTLGSVLIGHARPLAVKDIIGEGSKHKEQIQLYSSAVDVDGELEGMDMAGVLDLEFEWAQMPEKLGGGMSSKGTWILAVKVDEVFVPSQHGTTISMKVKFGDLEAETHAGTYKAPQHALNAVDKAIHGVVRRCDSKGIDHQTIQEVTKFTEDHIREAIGDPDKPPAAHPPPLPPLLTIELERIVYMVVPQQKSASPAKVELTLLDASKAVLATAEVEAEKLNGPALELPRLAMKCKDGGTIEAQVTLAAAPLER
mmetsp:Transcript_48092/g.112430  ORF Transcript_48092/g.112430 Transcript_48092/m.112430 type:complete len:1220 (-) Transcript_48092:178-3837(-)